MVSSMPAALTPSALTTVFKPGPSLPGLLQANHRVWLGYKSWDLPAQLRTLLMVSLCFEAPHPPALNFLRAFL